MGFVSGRVRFVYPSGAVAKFRVPGKHRYNESMGKAKGQFAREDGFVGNEAETIAMLRKMYPGQCPLCWLYRDDKEFLAIKRGLRRGPWGCWKRRGIPAYVAYYHAKHHLGKNKRSSYFAGEEWQRRRREGQRLSRWWWKPGQSGGGNRKGVRDRRQRMKPCGHKEAIQLEREERAARLRGTQWSGSPGSGSIYGSGLRDFE
jgi:hypothetical protein